MSAMKVNLCYPNVSGFSPHNLNDPEGTKVGRHHGNMVGSASHSEMHEAILDLWPTLEPLQWDREMEWRDT